MEGRNTSNFSRGLVAAPTAPTHPPPHAHITRAPAGLTDENQKVKTITALTISALAEAAAPYGIESFDDVLEPLWKGIRLLRGKVRARAWLRVDIAWSVQHPRGCLWPPPPPRPTLCPPPRPPRPPRIPPPQRTPPPRAPQVLAAFLKAIGFIIPLMDSMYANYYTREVMVILIRCVCVGGGGVGGGGGSTERMRALVWRSGRAGLPAPRSLALASTHSPSLSPEPTHPHDLALAPPCAPLAFAGSSRPPTRR